MQDGALLVGFAKNEIKKVFTLLNAAVFPHSPVFVHITLYKHEMNIKNANFSIVQYFSSNFCLGGTVIYAELLSVK